MKFNISLILALGLISNFLSAEEVPPKQVENVGKENPALEDAIQPRKEGATWMYRSYFFEDNTSISNGISKEEILGTKEIDGVTCYSMRITMDWRGMMDRLSGATLTEDDYYYFWEYFNEKGSYHFEDLDNPKGQPSSLSDFSLTLPYPVKKGMKYTIDDETTEVLETSISLEVPAGTFDCVLYATTYEPEEGVEDEDEYRDLLYMAKGVGLVRWESQIKKNDKWLPDMRDDLFKYDLNEESEANAEATEPEE